MSSLSQSLASFSSLELYMAPPVKIQLSLIPPNNKLWFSSCHFVGSPSLSFFFFFILDCWRVCVSDSAVSLNMTTGHTLEWLSAGYCMFTSVHALTSALRLWFNLPDCRLRPNLWIWIACYLFLEEDFWWFLSHHYVTETVADAKHNQFSHILS